ncbi:MAG: cation-translocating P-type ATPase [Bacillota bacterium]
MHLQWTNLTGEEVCRNLGTNPGVGLAGSEVESRRRRWGENILAEATRLSLPVLFINQFKDFMVLVLLGATLLSGLLGEYGDALTIMVIVLINAVLGLVQEYRAERSLEALHKLAAPRSRVLRAGEIVVIPAREVVPGDLVFLEAGDRISADLRLLSAQSLAVNEAALTGESEAVLKRTARLPVAAATPGDALNMAFSGTTVVAGRGEGVVVATAMQTELGRIAHLIEGAAQAATPLQERLTRLGKTLVAVCLVICFGVTLLGVFQGQPLYAMFMAGVSLAVAAIPEGLPAIVTVALALGVQRMIRRRAIVRRLPAVETLGSATVICTDKTGTLTENRMSVSQLYSGGRLYRAAGGHFQVQGEEGWLNVGRNGAGDLRLTLSIAACCNNAYEVKHSFRGDPTEVALMEASRSMGLKLPGRAQGRESEFPFSSERKMMSIIWRDSLSRRLLLKGAPEIVLERCRSIWSGERAVTLTRGRRRELLDQVERMAALGLRALAVAYRDLPATGVSTAEEAEKELTWVGLLGLEDPPRPEVLPAIRLCRRAGIRVIMITGDHRATAEAIARRLEILQGDGVVLTGRDLEAMDELSLQRLIGRVQVFARVSPVHKLRIVRLLRRAGEVVAMTGDGINDAPAVKEADIGIAMGLTGTDVTREAAALVLSDDNFSTIASAVEEGRNIYGNIRKFIRFLLGCNTGEVLTMVLAIVAGLPLPLRPIQILWINLVTDGLPAIALGVDRPDRFQMQQPPRQRKESIFSGGLWSQLIARGIMIAAVTVAVFRFVLTAGESLIKAQTMAFATLITAQLAYVFDCRGDGKPFWAESRAPNWYLGAAVASSCLLMFLVIYHPLLSNFFYTDFLLGGDWAVIVAAGLLPSLLDGMLLLLKGALARTKKKTAKLR